MYSILPAFAALYFLALGVISIVKSKYTPLSIVFFFVCITTFFWQGMSAVLYHISTVENFDFIAKFGYTFIIFLPTTVYHFLSTLSGNDSDKKYIILSYGLCVFFACLNVFSDFFLDGYHEYYWSLYPKSGLLHPIHIAQTFIVILRGLYLLIRKYRESEASERSKLAYPLVGMFVFLFSAVDYITNYGIELYPPGVIFIVIALTVIGYSIIKFELMDIQIAIGNTASAVITVVLYLSVYQFYDFWMSLFGITDTHIIRALYLASFILSIVSFERVRLLVRTPLEKKFLRGHYNIQKIVRDIALHIMCIKDSRQLIQSVSEELVEELEVSKAVYIILNHDSKQYDVFKLGVDEPIDSLKLEDSLVRYFDDKSDPYFLRELPSASKNLFDKYDFDGGCLAFPFQSQESLNGLIILGDKLSGEGFSSTDKDLMRSITAQVMTFFEIIKAGEIKDQIIIEQENIVKEKKKLDKDLAMAEIVQKNSLPSKMLTIEGYSIEHQYYPAKKVSGDFYAFFRLSEHKYGFLVADAVGKGVAAALITLSLKSLLEQYISKDLEPHENIERLNKIMYSSREFSRYMPMVYAVLDTQTNDLTVCNAGHDSPILISETNETLLESNGMPVGLEPDEVYTQHTVQLKDSDLFLMYTDGLPDAVNEFGETFGEEKISRALQNYLLQKKSSSFSSIVLQEWEQYRNKEGGQRDDMTYVFIERVQQDSVGIMLS